MESLRSFLKSWPGRIFLMLCLSPLAILGLESYISGSSNRNELIKVGDQIVTPSAFQEEVSRRRNELLQSGLDASSINNSVLKDEVMEGLTNQALLKHQAKALGMHVSDKYINDILIQDPQFKDAKGNFSNERFAFILKQQRMTKDQLFDEYRKQLSIGSLYNNIAQTAVYPIAGIEQLIKWQQEKRNVWLHRLDWQNYADKVTVSNDDLKAYYDTHQNDLNSLAMVDLSYVVLNPDKVEIDTITEEDINAEYEAYEANYSTDFAQKISQILLTGDQALERANSIEDKLKNGESFEQLAQTMSDDTVSRDNGGDIGTFNPSTFGEDGEKVAQALQGLKVGEVTQPIKTSFGYQLFKVTDIQGEPLPSLEGMRDQLEERVRQRKKATMIGDKITRINDMAIDGMSISDIADQENLQMQTIKDYSEQDNNTELNQPAIIEAAFDDFRIQDESVSTNISVGNDTIWLQPINYRPVMPLSLEQASGKIKQILTKQKAILMAEDEAKKIAKEINEAGNGIQAVNLTFTPLGEVTRQNSNLLPAEQAAVFSQESTTISEGPKIGKTEAVAQVTPKGASVLVMSIAKDTSPEPITDDQRQKMTNEVLQKQGQNDFADYIDYLKMATEIDKNEKLIHKEMGS